MTLRLMAGALVVGCLATAPDPAVMQTPSRRLSCDGPFRPDASAATLAKYFGSDNVADAEVGVGEGLTEVGTVIFGASRLDRIEVLWTEPTDRRRPRIVTVRQPASPRPASHWRTPAGLALGDSLRAVEQRNGRPFRLLGFEWDYAGTTMSWAGGRFETDQPSACRTRARFATGAQLTKERHRWGRQVIGDREFSSGHPAMQALDPYVYEIWLEYQ